VFDDDNNKQIVYRLLSLSDSNDFYHYKQFKETTFDKVKQCQESMKKPGGDIKKTTQWIEKDFLCKNSHLFTLK